MTISVPTAATAGLPAVTANPGKIARIRSSIDLSDRAELSTFGERAQQLVTAYADKILAQTRNRDMGETGNLLIDILEKAKGLDPASIKEGGLLSRLFS